MTELYFRDKTFLFEDSNKQVNLKANFDKFIKKAKENNQTPAAYAKQIFACKTEQNPQTNASTDNGNIPDTATISDAVVAAFSETN